MRGIRAISEAAGHSPLQIGGSPAFVSRIPTGKPLEGSMTLFNEFYEGWDTDGHLQIFDSWNSKINSHFNYSYGCFAEQKYLNKAVRSLERPQILDVGCATGTTYRFLRNTISDSTFHYRGVDLSGPAVERAKSLYPGVDFAKKDQEKLLEFVGHRYDIVYSRDTVMHQTKPLAFLEDLLSVTKKFLIIRLRTRDRGATVWDVEASCQMHYDEFWMPYIVINVDELLNYLKSNFKIAKITINKSYEVLGGQNYRYLPKDLYFKNAGGAETAMLIEMAPESENANTEVIVESFLEGQAYLRKYRMVNWAYSAVSRIAGRYIR